MRHTAYRPALTLATLAVPALLTLLALGACETTAPPGGSPPPGTVQAQGIPDQELGLSKLSVFDVAAPPDYAWVGASPGTNEPLPRAHAEAPPLVPHEMEPMLPITAEENICIDCHAEVDGDKPIGTPMSASHYTDLRDAPGKVQKDVVGARWVCVSCHVAQTDAVPLVELMK